MQYSLTLICIAGFARALFGQEENIYSIQIPKTPNHPALLQKGFRLLGKSGIITTLHGVCDGSEFIAVGTGKELLRGLRVQEVDVDRDVARLSSPELESQEARGFNVARMEDLREREALDAWGIPKGTSWNKSVSASKPARRKLGEIAVAMAEEISRRSSPGPSITVLGLDGALTFGYSGGPLIRADGSVVALVDGGLLEETGISWGIPIGDIQWKSVRQQPVAQRIAGLRAMPFGRLFAQSEASRNEARNVFNSITYGKDSPIIIDSKINNLNFGGETPRNSK